MDVSRIEKQRFSYQDILELTPDMTYEQLDIQYPATGGMVELSGAVGIISSYEERIFGDESRTLYLNQLNDRKEELSELIRHREDELAQLRIAFSFFAGDSVWKKQGEGVGRQSAGG